MDDVRDVSGVRGRPRSVSADEVLSVALGMFVERGYDAVTVDEIAVAVGTSRRSVFRLFPQKSDLVWGGLGEVHALILRQIEQAVAAEARGSVWQMLERAYLCGLAEAVDVMVYSRDRLRIIASTPSLAGLSAANRHDFVEELAVHVCAYEGHSDALRGRVVATVVAEVVGLGLWWWATNEKGDDYIAVVVRAFAALPPVREQ